MPANVARLRENLALNRIADATVRIEEMALGRAPGQATLMLCDGSKPGNAKIVGSGGVCVPMSTLDGLWRGCDCEPIGFIKIDTEGWDCEIVSGGREAIAACCPNMLIEFNRERMKNLGFSIAPCWQFLTQELQYRAFRIDHRGRTFPLTTPEEWENVLFLHPSREAEGMCRDSSALLGADGPAGFSRERQGRPS
jgi:FkbM family methyltransferase